MSLHFDDEYQTFEQWLLDADSLMFRFHEAIKESSLAGESEFIEKHAHAELQAMTRTFGKLLELHDQFKRQAA
jgi:hypothetical protein